jgi:hypothetical protein
MKVILHIGAHRCATTTFQAYLRRNATQLERSGIGFWGPRRTRKGLFSGLVPRPGVVTGRNLSQRAAGRVQIQLARSAGLGVQQLLVSDENMMGSVRMNLRLGSLYCGIGERLARFSQAFGARSMDVVISIRALDGFWASSMGYAVARGDPVPSRAMLTRIVDDGRGWRAVIEDLACAMPMARIRVAPFEVFAGRPEAFLQAVTAVPVPLTEARQWLNATPHLPQLRERIGPKRSGSLPSGDGRWKPFDRVQRTILQDRFTDDFNWLVNGGDGLARLLDEPDGTQNTMQAGQSPPWTDKTRGRRYDFEDRRMARAR